LGGAAFDSAGVLGIATRGRVFVSAARAGLVASGS
jgi:hypothetical protein